MGVGIRATGAGSFGVFLKAQEEATRLSLAHAKIGDEGALEVAHFVATSRHLTMLDLRGNDIGPDGAMHLAEAIMQSLTLESIILNHNRIGAGSEAGLAALCRALRANQTVRHVDLRHNGLDSLTFAAVLGEMLRDNTHLTHLELSWNRIGAAGGQVLSDHLKMNTTLFDCQLTGCGFAEDTLLAIAHNLHRNRKAHGADLQAGPYKVATEKPSTLVAKMGSGLVFEEMLQNGNHSALEAEREARRISGNMEISRGLTNEYICRLTERRAHFADPNDEGARTADEMVGHLDKTHSEMEREQEDIGKIRQRVELLGTGFRDREFRYREEIAQAQEKVKEARRERKEMKAIADRLGNDLWLQRERLDQEVFELRRVTKNTEADEARSRCVLNEVLLSQKELQKKLEDLEKTNAELEKEGARLRSRTLQLRENVLVFRS
eukprot:TRINITY_DN20528_c0_g1_i1.p1 TRINITY_DN20528_c0_g1~~TRINITY_DN20528_c0_g1_i1.p1  ORF type:complete len:436 (-),score=104.28 TRINITY_DN20528_c0_g1_i1:62-1369(-)